jgi:shikimate dehydrogenase
VEVLPLLDRLAPSAERIGAVNTLLWEEDGIHGLNTDGYGLEEGLREAFGLGMAGQSVLVLGAGGAARAAVAEAVHQGAARVLVANRTEERAAELARRFRGGITEVAAVPLAEAGARAGAGTLVINATSLGLRREDPPPFPAAELPERCLLYDMIYNPPETAWLAAGRARGYPVANGVGMLLHQGARALELWTDRPAPLAPMREALAGFLAGA